MDAGLIDEEEAARHPMRNVITRSLGAGEAPEPDVWELPPEAGERFVVCSDGLSNELDDAEIARIALGHADPQAVADELVAAAVRAGGRDNVSVVVVFVDPVDGARPYADSGGCAPSVDRRCCPRCQPPTSPRSARDHCPHRRAPGLAGGARAGGDAVVAAADDDAEPLEAAAAGGLLPVLLEALAGTGSRRPRTSSPAPGSRPACGWCCVGPRSWCCPTAPDWARRAGCRGSTSTSTSPRRRSARWCSRRPSRPPSGHGAGSARPGCDGTPRSRARRARRRPRRRRPGRRRPSCCRHPTLTRPRRRTNPPPGWPPARSRFRAPPPSSPHPRRRRDGTAPPTPIRTPTARWCPPCSARPGTRRRRTRPGAAPATARSHRRSRCPCPARRSGCCACPPAAACRSTAGCSWVGPRGPTRSGRPARTPTCCGWVGPTATSRATTPSSCSRAGRCSCATSARPTAPP